MRQVHRQHRHSSDSEGAEMAWFGKKTREPDVDTAPEVLTVRDQTVRDLMRFFLERGTSVPDAIRYSAFFVGFAVAHLASIKGAAADDSDRRRLVQMAQDAMEEGMSAVGAALDSEIGKILRAHQYI